MSERQRRFLPWLLMWTAGSAAQFWEDASSDSKGEASTCQRGSLTKAIHVCKKDPNLKKNEHNHHSYSNYSEDTHLNR